MKFLPSLNKRKEKVPVNFKNFRDHEELAERLTKTLYYGKRPQTDRPSLAVTDIAVELFSRGLPRRLDQLDIDYAASVSRNACVSPCSLMLALVYVDRLRRRNPNYLQQVSSSDIFLVSMMVASKFLNDEGEEDEVFNEEWAASADRETCDINRLEREFLAALDWNLFASGSHIMSALGHLEAMVALREGQRRGWFTYTDLSILLSYLSASDSINLLMENVCKVVLVCAVAYNAAILTVVGSACVVHHGLVPLVQRTFQRDMARPSWINSQQVANWSLPAASDQKFLPAASDQKFLPAYSVLGLLDEVDCDPDNSSTENSDAQHHGLVFHFPYFLHNVERPLIISSNDTAIYPALQPHRCQIGFPVGIVAR